MENGLTHLQSTQLSKATPTAEAIINLFIADQDVKQSSKDVYARSLRQYFNWIAAKDLTMPEISRTHILQYKEDLLNTGHSPLTVGGYLTAVRKLYAWGEANKYCMNVAKEIKTPKKTRVFKKEVLTSTEGKDLNSFYKAKTDKAFNLRDFAIVNLIQLTGLRTIEIVRANIADIQIREGKNILLIQGKGRDSKDQLVVLTPSTLEPLKAYLKTRPKAKDLEPLFVSNSNRNSGKRMTTRFVRGLVKHGLRNIGIDNKRYSAHSLRHTVGTFVYEKTGDLNAVQIALRHNSPVTSQIYAEKAIEKASLMNNPLEHMEGMFN